MCMSFCLRVYKWTMCMPSLLGPEDNTGTPRTGVIDNCNPQCRCWEPNPSPPQMQPVLYITELLLQDP